MAIKFKCEYCSFEIILSDLMAGDMLTCPSCRNKILVPSDAIQTDQEANIDFAKPYPRPHAPSGHEISYPPASGRRYETSLSPERPEQLQKSKEPTPWGISSVIKLVGAYILGLLLLAFIGYGIFTLLIHAIVPETTVNEKLFETVYLSKFFHVLEIVDSVFMIFLIYYSIVKRHHIDFFKALHLDKISKPQLFRYMYFAAATIGVIWLIEGVVSLTPLRDYIPKDLPIDKYFQKGIGEIAWFSFMAMVAPIPEELLFRGYMFEGFQYKLGTKWAAILVTVLFVLLHGPQLAFSPFHLLMISIAAIIFVIIRIRTNSLTKCIVYHFFYNSILTALLWGSIFIFGLESLKS